MAREKTDEMMSARKTERYEGESGQTGSRYQTMQSQIDTAFALERLEYIVKHGRHRTPRRVTTWTVQPVEAHSICVYSGASFA
jgi:hypothetical protein